jgi:Cellulase (glycosyl hydrolase family 5)
VRLLRIPLVLLVTAAVTLPVTAAAAPACSQVTDRMAPWRSGDLRGANIWQGRWGATSSPYPGRAIGAPITQADLDGLRALGANYVQLSVAGPFGERAPYAPDPVAEAVIDDVVAKAGRAGMFVVIAFRSGPGRNEQAISRSTNTAVFGPVVEDFWTSPTAQAAWLAMLRHTASRYGANPAVIGIDPLVEPNDVARRGFPPPAEFAARYGGTIEDVNRFQVRAAAAIRAVSDVPILVEGEGYGSVAYLPTVVPTGDPRTVYTVHFYEPMTYTNQAPGAGVAYPGAVQRRALAPVGAFAATHGVPVAVTEIGVRRYAPGAAQYLADTLRVLDDLGASHALWEFVVAAQRPLYNDFDLMGSPDAAVKAAVGGPLQTVVEAEFARNCARPPTPAAAVVPAAIGERHDPWLWAAIGAGAVLVAAALVRLAGLLRPPRLSPRGR